MTNISENDLHKLLIEWNNTVAVYPQDKCIPQLFESQVAQTPDAIALVFEDQLLTYNELNQRANQLAHYLQSQGIGPETLIAIYMERSLELVVGLLAVLKAGAAYVPIDVAYPPQRVAFILEDTHTPLVLTQAHLASQLPSGLPFCLDSDAAQLADFPTTNPTPTAMPDNLAYIIYTSGSTGKPKGVMIIHRGLTNYLWWAIQAYHVAQGQGSPVHSSIGFDLTVTSLFAPLLVGAKAILLPESQNIEALQSVLESHHNLSLVKITPAHLEILGQLLSPTQAAGQVNAYIIGGEALFSEQIAFWRKYAPATRLINEYGPTETVVGCCVYEVKPDEILAGTVPIGRPIANTQLYILDEQLQPVPIGDMGELYIGGDGVARGYLNRPDLTAERFLPNPFIPNGRMYKSGDLARYQPDGNMEYLGRVDDQVKIRGYRIELGEIEAVLSQYPSVQQVAVILREVSPGDKQLVAYLASSQPIAAEVYAKFLQQTLPDYMIPTHFVVLEQLPLTLNGKIDRQALPAPVFAPTSHFALPRTPLEQKLVKLWQELFHLEQIGIHDNFFMLGGHSLLATRLLSKCKEQLQLDLTMTVIFEQVTIAQLAEYIETNNGLHADVMAASAEREEFEL